jgi:hypothetical protein
MATQAAPLVEQIREAQTAPAPSAPPELLSSILDQIISASDRGSIEYGEALQMKTDFAQGVMYARGTSGSGKKLDAADIAMRIRFGRELGLSAFQAARGIYFINGIPAMMGTVLELLMKRHGYTWTFIQRDTKGCILELNKNGEKVMDGAKPARASFGEEDAKRTGYDKKETYKQDPESMYYWRALGRLQKFYVPEATEYVSVLAPGELPIDEVVAATESRMGEATAAAALREKLAAVTQAPVAEEVAA